MKNAAFLILSGLFLAACATTDSVEPATTTIANTGMTYQEASQEECRRIKETGSNLGRRVCHNRATWVAIEKAETEAAQAMRDRINGGGNSTATSGGGVGG